MSSVWIFGPDASVWAAPFEVMLMVSAMRLDLVADFGIYGQYVARALRQAARFRGYPKAIRTDQGPEFTGKALDQWAHKHGVQLKMIQAGNPT